MDLSQLPVSGIVTTLDWSMAGDGSRYKNFFCSSWQIITDKMVPIPGFRSTERWQILGWAKGKIVAIFPGCKIQGYIVCAKCPEHTENYMDDKSQLSGTPVGIYDLDNGKGRF